MAISRRCDAALGCTFVVWHGDVTLDEWHAYFEGLLADPEFPPGPSWLVDMRTAHGDLFDEAALVEVGERISGAAQRFGGMRLATVPNGAWDKARHVLEREMKVPGLTAMQFASVDTACVWLGLAPATALAVLTELREQAKRA